MKGLQYGRISLDHRGGTKSYHLAWISCEETGKSILMKRWGKKGAFGQLQVLTFGNSLGAWHAAQQMIGEKRRGGYEVVSESSADNTRQTLGMFFGPAVWNGFGAENIEFLDADIDTSGMKRAAPAATRDENDRFTPTAPRHVVPDPDVIRREELERVRREQEANPLFGMF